MPVRATMAPSNPTSTTPTALPCPSTTALVANVVDTDTIAMCFGCKLCGNCATANVMASVTPIARSPLVVMALAVAITRWPRASMMAASV